VLNSVDQAKAEHQQIASRRAIWPPSLTADPVRAVASGAVYELRAATSSAHRRHRPAPDRHHAGAGLPRPDRPGGGQGGALANDLEDSLVKLLVQVVPPEQREKVDPAMLHGPVVNPEGRTDVVSQPGRGRRPAGQPGLLKPAAAPRRLVGNTRPARRHRDGRLNTPPSAAYPASSRHVRRHHGRAP
jgi:hypothetical protein